MVLLHLLAEISHRKKWKLVVAHFNHQLRGRAGDLDEQLVRKTAATMKLPIIVESADVKSFADQAGLSVEMAARKLRHEFLARCARRKKIKTIALAHHADDQVELFFLRLLRGAGADGLRGMKWKSPSPADQRLWLVRPLLDATKRELEALAKRWGISFRQDATNFSSDFLRNRIRNELLPLLRKQYQPALSAAVLRAMEVVGAESELVREAAARVRADLNRVDSSSDGFGRLPAAIQRRILQMGMVQEGVVPDFDMIESLRKFPRRFVSISPIISIARDEKGKIQLRKAAAKQFDANERRVKLAGRSGAANFDGRKFSWWINEIDGGAMLRPIAASPRREIFDADQVGEEIILRHWRAGDRFQPIGRKSSSKLQDLFMNARIARKRRHELVLAVAANGEIFWVEGLRISENFKITPRTRRKISWRWSAP